MYCLSVPHVATICDVPKHGLDVWMHIIYREGVERRSKPKEESSMDAGLCSRISLLSMLQSGLLSYTQGCPND